MMKIACAVDEISSLTPDQIKAILDRDKKGEFLLLDVRQPEEYEAGHIPGATLIPLGELEARQGWYNAGFPTENLPLLSVHELKEKIDRGEELIVLDTRGQDEWDSGYIKGALHIYVGHLEQRLVEIPKDKPVAVICNVGHRAGLGASILLRAGYKEVYNVLGSVKAWVAAGFPITTD